MPRRKLLPFLGLLAVVGPVVAGEPAAAADVTAGERLTTPARWSASGEPSAGGYRVSLARGGLDVGLDFQRRVLAARPADARIDSAAPPGTMLPTLSLGLRSVSGTTPASSLVDRTLGGEGGTPYVSKVGIEYKPAQSQVFLNHGVGVRLSGDDRLTMRLRKGSLGIYMKRNF